MRLTVADQGIGIPAERLPHIFDRLERGVSPRHYGGLGIGLFLARKIVAAHEGELEVVSELGLTSRSHPSATSLQSADSGCALPPMLLRRFHDECMFTFAMKETATLTQCNCLALRQAARRVTQFYDQELAGSGIRVTQFSILYLISERGPMTVKVIAKELVMERTTLTRNLRPLLKDRLVSIEVGADRRARQISITPAGRAAYRRAQDLWRRAQRSYEAQFGEARCRRFRARLHEIAHSNLTPSRRQPAT